jgi:hypothetical protein
VDSVVGVSEVEGMRSHQSQHGDKPRTSGESKRFVRTRPFPRGHEQGQTLSMVSASVWVWVSASVLVREGGGTCLCAVSVQQSQPGVIPPTRHHWYVLLRHRSHPTNAETGAQHTVKYTASCKQVTITGMRHMAPTLSSAIAEPSGACHATLAYLF